MYTKVLKLCPYERLGKTKKYQSNFKDTGKVPTCQVCSLLRN